MRNLFNVFLLVVLLTGAPAGVYAQSSTDSVSLSPVVAASPSAAGDTEYVLPYPGIMPDSPLYFLKVTRDKVIGFLIADPVKKSEFNILQADKRLGAGVSLFEKHNYILAQSTLSKGLNYFEEAIDRLEDGRREGKSTETVTKKLQLSLTKHQQVYNSLAEKSPADVKPKMVDLQKRVSGLEKRVNKFVQK